MKALRLVETGKPLEEHDLPVPEPGEGEILVEVKAAGICHSDVHYRTGTSFAGPLPLTPGHEVAGIVRATGGGARRVAVGDAVALHYLTTCGSCEFCAMGQEQFCASGRMIGKHRDGGYAEFIVVPERSAVPFAGERVPFEHAAVMMCSSATSFHALRKARMKAGETVAVFGAGGLGMSAIQLARALGAADVYAVDINPEKLAAAARYGAIAVDGKAGDAAGQLRELTGGRGVDVALELIGSPLTMDQAIRSLAVFGRAALAGITRMSVPVDTYRDLIGREAELIGVSDHLMSEFPLLFRYAERGVLDLRHIVTATVPLSAEKVNAVLDALETGTSSVRTVITP